MLKKLVTCALALISVIFIAGCAKSSYDPSDGGVLNEDVALEIKHDFFASDYNYDDFSSPESVVIYEYFGKFGNSYVVDIVPMPQVTVCLEEEICGYKFEYNVPIPLLVYNQGNFYRLQKAVDEGILNEADIAVIYENFGDYNRFEKYPPS